MSVFKVILENSSAVFSIGGQIFGRVEIDVEQEIIVKDILVKITGEAITEWGNSREPQDSDDENFLPDQLMFKGYELFYRPEIKLLDDNGVGNVLPRGVHKYNFKFDLPENIPGTFIGTWGRVKYEIKAMTKEVASNITHKAELPFVVETFVDFNYHHLLAGNNRVINRRKNMRYCCWTSGFISFELQLPYTSLTVGQELPINLSIENIWDKPIENIQFIIMEVVHYFSNVPFETLRQTEKNIAFKAVDGMEPMEEKVFNETLVVPSDYDAPSMMGCKSIKSYFLFKLEIVLPHPHLSLVEKVLLKIGHPRPMGRGPRMIGFGDLLETPPAYYPSVSAVPAAVPSTAVVPVPVPSTSSIAPTTAPPPFPGNELIDGIQVDPQNTLNNEPLPPSYEEATAGK